MGSCCSLLQQEHFSAQLLGGIASGASPVAGVDGSAQERGRSADQPSGRDNVEYQLAVGDYPVPVLGYLERAAATAVLQRPLHSQWRRWDRGLLAGCNVQHVGPDGLAGIRVVHDESSFVRRGDA